MIVYGVVDGKFIIGDDIGECDAIASNFSNFIIIDINSGNT